MSFGAKQRFVGEAAKTQEVSNLKNTVGSFKRLAGTAFADIEFKEYEASYITAPIVEHEGQIAAKVCIMYHYFIILNL